MSNNDELDEFKHDNKRVKKSEGDEDKPKPLVYKDGILRHLFRRIQDVYAGSTEECFGKDPTTGGRYVPSKDEKAFRDTVRRVFRYILNKHQTLTLNPRGFENYTNITQMSFFIQHPMELNSGMDIHDVFRFPGVVSIVFKYGYMEVETRQPKTCTPGSKRPPSVKSMAIGIRMNIYRAGSKSSHRSIKIDQKKEALLMDESITNVDVSCTDIVTPVTQNIANYIGGCVGVYHDNRVTVVTEKGRSTRYSAIIGNKSGSVRYADLLAIENGKTNMSWVLKPDTKSKRLSLTATSMSYD